jgi:hypothetical protein
MYILTTRTTGGKVCVEVEGDNIRSLFKEAITFQALDHIKAIVYTHSHSLTHREWLLANEIPEGNLLDDIKCIIAIVYNKYRKEVKLVEVFEFVSKYQAE